MKYGFVINATITIGIEVEADSLEQAVALARSANIQSLCHQCAKGNKDEWTTSGELDFGPPGECDLVDFHGDDENVDYDQALAAWQED